MFVPLFDSSFRPQAVEECAATPSAFCSRFEQASGTIPHGDQPKFAEGINRATYSRTLSATSALKLRVR